MDDPFDLTQFTPGNEVAKARLDQQIDRLREAKLAGTRLLIEAEGLLCDPNGGETANELAARIRTHLKIIRLADNGNEP